MSTMATGYIADSCVLWTGFDVSIVARSYAQLNSLLAGFAFVVINLVIDRVYERHTDGHPLNAREVEHESLIGVALVCSFLGLVLTALRYSLLAGENGCALSGGRAASGEVLGAVAFGASIYILLYAIVQFISGAVGRLASQCVFLLAVFVPPITFFFVEHTLTHLAVSLGDPNKRQALQPLWDNANRLAMPVTLVLLVLCAIPWCVGIKRRRSEAPLGPIARHVLTFLPYVTVALVGLVIMRSITALPATNTSAHITPAEAWLWLVLLAVVLLLQSSALSLQKGVEIPIVNEKTKA